MSATSTRPGRFGSDVAVDLLADLGIEHVAFNPGATFRAIHDSLVNRSGTPIEVLECLHEEISVAIAHGFAKATGRPMAAAVHDVVGLQHASMAIYNAWCDRVPLLVLGGTGPVDAAQRRPWIDWVHTATVQATQVRDYTKWDDQPASIEAMAESLIRAVQLTRSAPAAPVYVCIDSAVQEAATPAGFASPDVDRYQAPSDPSPPPAAIDVLAHWLIDAERPVVVADLVGRSQSGFASLVRLAERLALPVIDREGEYWKNSLNFPTRHPLNLSGDRSLTAEADLLVAFDVLDLHGLLQSGRSAPALHGPVPTNCRVAATSTAHLLVRAWAADYQRLQPADLHIGASAASVLPALETRVEQLLADDVRPDLVERIDKRRASLTGRSAARRACWDRAAVQSGGDGISHAALAKVVDEATRHHDRVVANGHLGNWVHRLWDLSRPHQYLGGQGGAGLGYGLGASIGAALAHRNTERLVIDFQTDGDALMTPGALWTAAHHRIPLLIVMDNNRAYNNSIQHQRAIAELRQRKPGTCTVGTGLDDPCVDFAALATSMGVQAEGPFTDIDELPDALDRAVKIVAENRRPVLLDVVTQRSVTTVAKQEH